MSDLLDRILRLPRPARAALVERNPLSLAQERLWFISRLIPGRGLYAACSALRMRGALDEDALLSATDAIARRHAILRTRFPEIDGEPVQLVEPFQPATRRRADLSGLPPEKRDRELAALMRREAQGFADLGAGPPLRLVLVRLGPLDHCLVLVIHHIASDRRSADIYAEELTRLYAARVGDSIPALAELPIQFADYARWERDARRADCMSEDLDWWERKLSDAPPLLTLPTDRPRRPRPSHRGARLKRRLPAELSTATLAYAARRRTTPFVVLLAAFYALLARQARTGDIVFGVPINRRDQRDTEGLIGIFVDTLPLRVTCPLDASFDALVETARASTLGALDHRDVPFELIVQRLRRARQLSHHPVFQVMFNVDTASLKAPTLQGLEIEQIESDLGTSRFDLAMSVDLAPDRLSLQLEYDADLFDRSRMTRMLDQFAELLPGLLADDRHRIDGSDILGNDAEPLPMETTPPVALLLRLDEHAATRPDAVAVEAGNSTITYAGLARRIRELATLFAHHGVAPYDHVAVMLDRTPDIVATLLSLHRLGAAYVPLDRAEAPRRRDHILQDCNARHLICDADLSMEAVPKDIRRIHIGGLPPSPGSGPARAMPAQAPAYTIYTSGSTGRPKGVVVSRANCAAFLGAISSRLRTGAADRWLAVTTVGFDIAAVEMFLPLLAGARLHLASREDTRDGHRLRSLLARHAITSLQATPATWRLLCDTGWRREGLAHILCGGERLDATLAVALNAGSGSVTNLYGPTEATIWATAHDVLPGEDPVPIGVPLAGTAAYVLDARLRPLPPEVRGEVFLSGPQVAQGYLGRPAETAAHFLPDPLAADPGARMYRTGDAVRRRVDGALIYLGRSDRQIKLRGHRIEIAEVEAALQRATGAREVAVILDFSGDPDGLLVGFMTGPGQPDAALLAAEMPEYMRPAKVIRLGAMPRLANGKLDRQALIAYAREAPAADRTATRSLTECEALLARIWTEVRGTPPAGPDEDFFTNGGHSLMITRFLARLRDRAGVELPLSAVFETPRLSDLALRVAKMIGERAPELVAEVTDRLSSGQRRLWLQSQFYPDGWHYHSPLALHLTGPLDPAALLRALAGIAARHDILRTCYPVGAGGPRRAIATPPTPLFVELSSLGSATGDAETAATLTRMFRSRFDLEHDPPWRAALLRLAPDRHVLAVVFHHIALDGQSAALFFADLAAGYGAELARCSSRIAYPTASYSAFVSWQEARAKAAAATDLDFWAKQLHGAPLRVPLPWDYPCPGRPSHRGQRIRNALSPELTNRIAAAVADLGTTAFLYLLTAFKLVLAWHCEIIEVTVGTNDGNRRRTEFELMIGNLAELLVLRSNLAAARSFREAHAAVRDAFVAAEAHSAVGFDRVVEALRPARVHAGTPWINVIFTHLDAAEADIRFSGLKVATAEMSNDTAKFELTLTTARVNGCLLATLEYMSDLFLPATAERLLARFSRLLARAAEGVDQPLEELGAPITPASGSVSVEGPPLDSFLRRPARQRSKEDGICQI